MTDYDRGFKDGQKAERQRIKDYIWEKYGLEGKRAPHGRTTALRQAAKDLILELILGEEIR